MALAPARLDERWSAASQLHAGSCAVVASGDRWSHGEVASLASVVTAELGAAGVGPGHRVAVVARPGPEGLAVLRAVLALGASYVPIADGGTVHRDRRALDRARPAAVVYAGVGCEARGPTAGCVLEVRGDRVRVLSSTAAPAPWRDTSDAVGTAAQEAYVLFTSGSTGSPKGVSVSHANAGAFVDWAVGELGISAAAVLAGSTPWTFDLSVFDVFASQLTGAALCVLDVGATLAGRRVVATVRDEGVTHWLSVPAMAAAVLRSGRLDQPDLPSLREWMWCGERMPPGVLRALMEQLPHVAFTNLYGPTETTTASTFHRVTEPPAPDADVPIGRGLWPGTVHVLDGDGLEASEGAEGEICITGPGVTRGYLDADGTAVAFDAGGPGWRGARACYRTGDIGVRDALGVLRFVGRRDGQLNVDGVRVEVGEIEAALQAVAGVAEAAVFVPEGESTVVAAVVLAPGVDLAQVRADLGGWLPTNLHPRRWILVVALPRSPHGKVDRAALGACGPPAVQPTGCVATVADMAMAPRSSRTTTAEPSSPSVPRIDAGRPT